MAGLSSTELDFAGAYDRLIRRGQTVTPQSLVRAAAPRQRVDSRDLDRARDFLDTRLAVMQRAETPVVDTIVAAPTLPVAVNTAASVSDAAWDAITPDEAKSYLTELMAGADHAYAVIAKHFVPIQEKLSPLSGAALAGAFVFLGSTSALLGILPPPEPVFIAVPAAFFPAVFACFATEQSLHHARDKAPVAGKEVDRGIRALLAETKPGYLAAVRHGLQSHLDASGRRAQPYFRPADENRVRNLIHELDAILPGSVAHTLLEQLATFSINFEQDHKGERSGRPIVRVLLEMPTSHREPCAQVLLERLFQDGEPSARLRNGSRNRHDVNALYRDLMAAAPGGTSQPASSSPHLLPWRLRF